MDQDDPTVGRQTAPCEDVDPQPAGRYDLVVLGGGPEAVAAARAGRRPGRRVALIVPPSGRHRAPAELRAAMDVLWQAAAGPAAPRLSPAGSWTRQPPGAGRPGLEAMLRQASGLGARLGQAAEPGDLTEPGIDVFAGQAAFAGPAAVEVEGRPIPFRRAIIATGGAPVCMTVEGAEPDDCLTAEGLMNLAELPRRVAILGLDPGHCEWAQVLCRLGCRVHLIGHQARLLPDEEPEAAGVVQKRLERDGVRLDLGCDRVAIERAGNSRVVLIERGRQKQKLFVDQILLDPPRGPHVAGLHLEAAGVAATEHGILVGDRLQTANRRVFAAGEVCGPPFACRAAAEAMARLAAANAFAWFGRAFDKLAVPRCVWTDPQVVRIGMTPGEAAERGWEVNTYRAEMSEVDRALFQGPASGFAVVHVRSRSGRIVGATIVAHQAQELAGPLLLARAQGIPLSALADVVPCYPGKLELLRLVGRRCQKAQPSRRWSRLAEWAAACRRRTRGRIKT